MNNYPRPRAKEKACDTAIKNTLAYRAVFKYPMSFYQLGTFLITEKILDYEIFSKELTKLCKNRSVKVKGSKYFLTGFKPVSWPLRTKQSHEQIKKIGPNIFVDETKMGWDKEKQNIYVAHEILMMHPVISREDAYFKFLNSNVWIYKYFANQAPEKEKYTVKESKTKHSKLIDFIENSLYILQYLYMRKKKTNEIIKRNFVHFNKTDSTKDILTQYE